MLAAGTQFAGRALLRTSGRSRQVISLAPLRPLPRIQVLTASTVASANSTKPQWSIRLLYDGDCPLCMKEVNFLMERCRKHAPGAIDFVDISSPSYSANSNYGITFEQAMRKIHAITADGKIVTGIEVFRRLYEAVGLGWVYAITANPIVEKIANMIYELWAVNRMNITGREALDVIFERRRQAQAGEVLGSMCGEDGTACEIPPPKAKVASQTAAASSR